jgi:hypothetical protein
VGDKHAVAWRSLRTRREGDDEARHASLFRVVGIAAPSGNQPEPKVLLPHAGSTLASPVTARDANRRRVEHQLASLRAMGLARCPPHICALLMICARQSHRRRNARNSLQRPLQRSECGIALRSGLAPIRLRSTEPKATGSNPVGRALEDALQSQIQGNVPNSAPPRWDGLRRSRRPSPGAHPTSLPDGRAYRASVHTPVDLPLAGPRCCSTTVPSRGLLAAE